MGKPEITILIPSLSQSTDSFKELGSTLLLNLYKIKPHTGLQATYQLSRRLNMISLPTQLTPLIVLFCIADHVIILFVS